MTINDIISHKWSAQELYTRLKATTIQLAAKEPLRLSDLCKKDGVRAPKQVLPTGVEVSYGGALCFYCLQTLIGRYSRSVKPDKFDIAYMAGEMMFKYPHWTILDLPTFVSMCISARLPTMKFGVEEWELFNLDIPAIMGKLESYDRMRPNPQALQGGSPEKATEKELSYWCKTHLLDGTPYEWTDMEVCKKYWQAPIDMSNESERKFRENAGSKLDGCVQKV